MLRMLIALTLALLLGCVPALAEFPEFENQIPDEPMFTENEFVAVTAEYDAAADLSRYEIRIRDAAQFPDGSPLTAEDLIFSWYFYLDPGYAGEAALNALDIPGLESYRLQMSADSLAAARSTLAAIAKNGAGRAWTETDPWTQAQHETWQSLQNAYAAACRDEYPKCVQSIVDVCRKMLLSDGAEAFGMSAEAVAADEGLSVAHAMMTWGYASCKENLLTSSRTRTVWQLDADATPTIDDFVNELKSVYGDDLAACWAVETSGAYTPALPDPEAGFLQATAAASTESVPAIEGIRLVDDTTVEVLLTGIDLRSEGELLGIPMLSKTHFADSALWNPDAGLYGHTFGDVSAIENALAEDNHAHTVTPVETVSGAFVFTY